MNKRCLRGIAVALLLIPLLVTLWVHAAAAGAAWLPGPRAIAAPAIRFDPPSSAVNPGATFVLNVIVDNVVDLGAFEFTVAFDSGVVQVQGVTLGPFLGSTGRTTAQLGPNIDNSAGSFIFGGFSFGTVGGPNGTGTVAQVTLRAVGAGSTALTFSAAQLTDTQAPPTVTYPTVIPGLVTVSGPTATPTLQRIRIYLPILRKAVP